MYFLRIRVSFSFILLRLLRSRSDRPSEVLQLPHRNAPVQTPWSILRRWHWPLQSHPYYPEIPWYEQHLHIQRLLLPEQLPDFSVPDGSVPRYLPAEFRSRDPVRVPAGRKWTPYFQLLQHVHKVLLLQVLFQQKLFFSCLYPPFKYSAFASYYNMLCSFVKHRKRLHLALFCTIEYNKLTKYLCKKTKGERNETRKRLV